MPGAPMKRIKPAPPMSTFVPFDGVIVLHGASIWGNTPDGGTDVAAKLQVLLSAASVHIVWVGNATFNGIGGSPSLSSDPTYGVNAVDAFWDGARRNRVYVGSGAELDEINDYQPRTAAQVYSSCASYITALKALHAWEVWPASCIATTENTAANPPDYQSIRDAYNALIAADFAGGNGYANLISTPELQDATNSTNYYDGIHLRDPGRQAVANKLATYP